MRFDSIAEKDMVNTATCNAAKHLPKLIESLRRQTDKDFEWVIANGASTDGTRELLQSVTDIEIVISSQTDFGIYDALNRAIKKAGALVCLSMSGPENLPPLEAFALECPVVASDIPGASEHFGDCARLVSAFSPESIATALYEVLTNSDARKVLVTRGQSRARAWTSRHFVQGVLKIVDEFEPVRRCWPPSSASRS